MSGGRRDRGVSVSSQTEEFQSQRRDRNLSDLIRHIRDEGPASVMTDMAQRPGEQSEPGSQQGQQASPDAETPPHILVEPLSGGFTRKRRRSGLVLAGIAAVVVVIGGLALFFTGAGVQVLPAAPADHPLPNPVADRPAGPEEPVNQAPDGIASITREENERLQRIQSLVAEDDRVSKERIARLEAQVEQTRQAQSELTALARRLERAARQAKETSAAAASPAGAPVVRTAAEGTAGAHVQGPLAPGQPEKREPAATDALTADVQSIAMQGKKKIAEALASSTHRHPAGASGDARPEAPAGNSLHAPKLTVAVSRGDTSEGSGAGASAKRPDLPQQTGGQQADRPQPSVADQPKRAEPAPPDLAPSQLQMKTAQLLYPAAPAPTRGGAGSAPEIPAVAMVQPTTSAQQRAPKPLPAAQEVLPVKTPMPPPVRAPGLAKTPSHKTAPPPKEPPLPDPFAPTDSGGSWAINLVAVSTRERAQAAQQRYREKGFQTEVSVLRRSNSRPVLFGVEIPGFSSRQDAAALVPTLKQRLGIKTVWIRQER
jgi:hypothetical protein